MSEERNPNPTETEAAVAPKPTGIFGMRGPAFPIKPLPEAPRIAHVFGPGAILAAMGIGVGELFTWPRMTILWGAGVLWLCTVGVFIQYIVTMEMSRWETATGESIFMGAYRIGAYGIFMWMFFIYALFLYIWPGWLATGGAIAEAMTGIPWMTWAWIFLLLIGFILSVGRVVYTVVEWIQTVTVLYTILVGIVIAALVTPWHIFAEAMAGWVQFGYWHADMKAAQLPFIVGALAYAGPSGMQQMWYTLWLRDDRAGMGAYIGRITALTTRRVESIPEHGFTFDVNNPAEMAKWKAWRRWATWDAVVLFWGFTMLITFLFVLFAMTACYTKPALVAIERAGKTMPIINGMGTLWGETLGMWAYYLFMFAAIVQVWNTGFGVYDGYARGQADMVYFGIPQARKLHLKWWYYIFLWASLIVAMFMLTLGTPLFILTMAMFLACPVMGMYCAILAYTNWRFLPKPIRINPLHLLVLVIGSVFYIGMTLYCLIVFGAPVKG
jgi:hypothetical protein